MVAKTKKITSKFILLNGEGLNEGTFNSFKEAGNYTYTHEVYEGTILEVVKAWSVYSPEEPMPEIEEIDLKDLGT